jgi:membrane-bound metal-dependent hydrolase YbcI (DUF457 family)
MPSPIAHLGVGYAIYRQFNRKLPSDQRRIWKFPLQMVLVAGLSLLPDLDVIPAALFRDMQKYHNNFSHSPIFAIPVALLVSGIFQRTYRSNFWLFFFICLISYDLHILMDALTAERGVILFWPFSNARYASSVKIFHGLQWGFGWFSPWHLWTIFTESLFVIIVIGAVNYFEKRKNKVNTILSKEN